MTKPTIGFKTPIQEKDEVIAKQAQRISGLEEQVRKLQAENGELKRFLAQPKTPNITIESDEPEADYLTPSI